MRWTNPYEPYPLWDPPGWSSPDWDDDPPGWEDPDQGEAPGWEMPDWRQGWNAAETYRKVEIVGDFSTGRRPIVGPLLSRRRRRSP